ncbi:hypothetical protein [Chryseobacterium sp. RLHN22]|uniref:hypothetical protein n=1 Tax=Chryseobacterium sp. RLHN22 TaxID=3437885 RepID=UPI003D9BD226
MKTLKIYSTITTIAIITLSVLLYQSDAKLKASKNSLKQNEKEIKLKEKFIKESEEVLQQCSDRYYREISKSR